MISRQFDLSGDFYPDGIILAGLKDYASFDIRYDGSSLTITADTEEECLLVFREFMNYLVYLLSQTDHAA